MTEEPEPQEQTEQAEQAGRTAADGARSRAARERDRQRVFGDVLDDATLDDRPEPAADADGDRWLRDNVPPHHGG